MEVILQMFVLFNIPTGVALVCAFVVMALLVYKKEPGALFISNIVYIFSFGGSIALLIAFRDAALLKEYFEMVAMMFFFGLGGLTVMGFLIGFIIIYIFYKMITIGPVPNSTQQSNIQ